MRILSTIVSLFCLSAAVAQFAPAANQAGTTAIHKDSSTILGWATGIDAIDRGPQNIVNGAPLASFGDSTQALGPAEGGPTTIVSLGDGGSIVLTFDFPIKNESGPDFAVFENSFDHSYLEFAHVEVSTDGQRFVRFPSTSLTQTTSQTGPYENSDPTKVNNLAGKYAGGYGTPFDLDDIADSTDINLDSINYVKIIDVVGSIDPAWGTIDALGNLINDPYPTDFEPGGFDLDAVAAIHLNGAYLSILKSENEVKLYPNPTAQYLKSAKTIEGLLLDLSGRTVWQGQIDQNGINLLDLGLEKGMYIFNSGESTQRIIFK